MTHTITGNQRIFGLIGYPLGHSFSAEYFNNKFEEEGIEAVYLNFPIDNIDKFPTIFDEYSKISGLNVTIPYKEQVLEYLDSVDETAAEIGAVNVIKVRQGLEGTLLTGFNTDVVGFMESIRPLIGYGMRKALVLGTGGASKAVKYGLRKLGIDVTLVSRRRGIDKLSYDELTKEIIMENKIIINTTPLGTYPAVDTCPPIPYEFISDRHLCYDLVYNPKETLFLKRSQNRGAIVKNGLEMLHIQAEEAWKIWNLL